MTLFNSLLVAGCVTALGALGALTRRGLARIVLSSGVMLCGLWIALGAAGRFLYPGTAPAMLIALTAALAGVFAALG
ncbi:MAG: hypothetical protein PHW69_07680, partial [Elusimicrobiaceae bacterium]|nr:hypothetical protein [Elusimicrobiaceae bacterium]